MTTAVGRLASLDGPIATIRLDRPDAGNAIDLPLAEALREAVRTIARQDTVRVVVLTAEGTMFCAGGDVRSMAQAGDRELHVADLAAVVHDSLIELRSLSVPVIAAVNGTAAGAGIGLVLSADIAVGVDDAEFIAAYPKIALSPDCGVTALLPQAVGPRRAALFHSDEPNARRRNRRHMGTAIRVVSSFAPRRSSQRTGSNDRGYTRTSCRRDGSSTTSSRRCQLCRPPRRRGRHHFAASSNTGGE